MVRQAIEASLARMKSTFFGAKPCCVYCTPRTDRRWPIYLRQHRTRDIPVCDDYDADDVAYKELYEKRKDALVTNTGTFKAYAVLPEPPPHTFVLETQRSKVCAPTCIWSLLSSTYLESCSATIRSNTTNPKSPAPPHANVLGSMFDSLDSRPHNYFSVPTMKDAQNEQSTKWACRSQYPRTFGGLVAAMSVFPPCYGVASCDGSSVLRSSSMNHTYIVTHNATK